jgi:histidine phosphotransferase ChpT
MSEESKMAELLCTRLCHDLTGPIGAVSNGAEFLSEEGFNMQGQAVELIISSAFSAVTRLQFYRMAYGSVKDGGEANLADKQKLASDFFSTGNVTLDWPDSNADGSNVSISIKMARIILNLLIIGSSVLMRGGSLSVRISQDDAGAKRVSVTAKGTHVKWDTEISQALEGQLKPEALTPKNVQLQLTYQQIKELHARFVHKVSDAEVVLELVQDVQP